MFDEIRERMEQMRDRWTGDSQEQQSRKKAIEYMQMAEAGRDAYQTFVLESRFGDSSLKYHIFYFLDNKKCRNLLQLLFVAFVLAELLPKHIQWIFDGALLGIFTLQAMLKQYSIGSISCTRRTCNRWLVITLFIGLWVQQLGIGEQHGYFMGVTRPILIMVKSRGVRSMMRLISKCIYSARVIFVLFFTVTTVTAVMGTLLFATKFDPQTGKTVDNFFDSFVATFVFLVSLENYGLVYQGYTVSKMAWIFFVPISIIGVFFLTSMVIARFELAYIKYKKILSEFESKQRRFAIAVAFALSTTDELRSDTFVDMMSAYWNLMGVNLNGIRDRMAQIQMAASHASLHDAAGHDSPSGTQRSAALMIFDIIDRDNSLTICFDEFELVVAVSKCVAVISDDPIIAFQTIACRMELLLKESHEKMARLAPDKAKAHARILDRINRHEFVFEQAIDQLSQCKTRIHGSMRLTWYFTMAALDQVTMTALICHTFVLSLYGTTEGRGWMDGAAIAFCAFYTVEMCCRLAAGTHCIIQSNGMCADHLCCAAKSWSNFCNDPRGSVHSFRNIAAFVLWLVGIITTAMALDLDRSDSYSTWTAVSSLALWRTFVVAESFRDTVFSCFRGLGAVSYLFSVFMIFFYFYAYAGHVLFRGLTYEDGHVDFSTFETSCLTMVQVCLGEGWHEIM